MLSNETETASVFHAGEIDAQERVGVRDIEAWAQKVVRSYLPQEHRDFHTSLPFLVAAAADNQGRPWVTLLTGANGFVTSSDPHSLSMDVSSFEGDPLIESLTSGDHLGLLGIELSQRRRNRVNGRVKEYRDGKLEFSVDQSFGNCPQYIHARDWERVAEVPNKTRSTGQSLTNSQQSWISSAGTLFTSSGYVGTDESPTNGMDASHRGGIPGFVKVINDTRLQFPDYSGNNHFNTIGNILVNPKIGLLFVDFETGSLLHLTGRASIDWDSDEVANVPGAKRLVNIEIDEIVERPSAIPLRWSTPAEFMREIRLIDKKVESKEITSFVFEAWDGSPLPISVAGQYLPLNLDIQGIEGAVTRTYSLSGPPSKDKYRISVKRDSQGLVSRLLHDQVEVGAILSAGAATGDLLLPQDDAPIVLISAGVGITPMMSMLHALSNLRDERPVWFIHGARNGAYHAFSNEVRSLVSKRPGIQAHTAYSAPSDCDKLGLDYDSEGRVSGELISSIVSAPGAHYFLCGPTQFMAQVQEHLEKNGVLADQIFTESF
jgi:uncharacterized protein